jgi:hypothetical protein
MKKVTPIFIFSLPRSGSTLLQRLIAMHSDVATESETWLLLPLFLSAKNGTGISEYNDRYAAAGISEVLEKIENGEEKYHREVAKLAGSIYSSLARNGEQYFLEKTPRYHLITNEIIESFPDAKFIFLWRSPLAIIGSIISSWGNDRWNVYRYYIDLYKGLENLVSAFEKHKDRSIGLNYEMLLEEPNKELRRVMEYLELTTEQIDPDRLGAFVLNGSLGDKTGTKKYKKLSKEPLDKWKSQIGNPVRRAWCYKYLEWIDGTRLSIMGYDINELQNQLSTVRMSPRFIVSDMGRMIFGYFFNLFNLSNVWTKIRMIRKGKRIYPYS